VGGKHISSLKQKKTEKEMRDPDHNSCWNGPDLLGEKSEFEVGMLTKRFKQDAKGTNRRGIPVKDGEKFSSKKIKGNASLVMASLWGSMTTRGGERE